ncbi:MAG: hypothetical protein E5W55_01585 [Mesorhizobium sp.]|nr:MAG: hypothetical protein E5W55_01585 [Mesorhizobium sp.]
MTNFYHYTSADALYGIGLHGLTVGDVPTDIRKGKGVIGVWLTTSEQPQGHGLDHSGRHKLRYRLSIDFPKMPPTFIRGRLGPPGTLLRRRLPGFTAPPMPGRHGGSS